MEPDRVVGLRQDHPAVIEGRTLFPSTVVPTRDSPRFLVSGKNSPKTGSVIAIGPWAGMPVYTITLEERATCPRSCHAWNICMGNSIHLARRNDARDPDFIPALAAEVITVGRTHPDGFVIRLHILGDFFSAAYVRVWGHLLDMVPQLRVWGYTARREDLDDLESREIAAALRELSEAAWDRFAIRTSHTEPGWRRTIIVDQDPKLPDVIVCPAETHATASCSTCGLCWAPAASRKTIAFLRHGMKAGPKLPKDRAPAQPQDDPEIVRRRNQYNPRARYHPRTGTLLNPAVLGSADRLAVGTPEDRIASIDADERARIAAVYGVKFKTKDAAE